MLLLVFTVRKVICVGSRHVGPWYLLKPLEARYLDIFNITVRSSCNCDISVGLNSGLNGSGLISQLRAVL